MLKQVCALGRLGSISEAGTFPDQSKNEIEIARISNFQMRTLEVLCFFWSKKRKQKQFQKQEEVEIVMFFSKQDRKPKNDFLI